MKKVLNLIAFIFLLHVTAVYAQPSAAIDPEGFTSGQIVLPDNSTITGTVKENIRKKGELIVLNNGKKTKYKAGDINSAQIGSSQYITWNYTFYEVVFQGKNLTLLRKANEPSGTQYNGSDAVVISSEGSVDDLFIKKNTDVSLRLLSKKNVKEVLGQLCPACPASVDETKFDAELLKKAVEDCDKCK
jgi:hypothetical protein